MYVPTSMRSCAAVPLLSPVIVKGQMSHVQTLCLLDTLFAHLSLTSLLWDIGSASSAEPDQMPHYVASDQVLHCLLKECSIKI